MKPFRVCALCSSKIREKARLCDSCAEKWIEDLTSPWMRSIIEYSEYEYNLAMRNYRRIISLEKVKNLI